MRISEVARSYAFFWVAMGSGFTLLQLIKLWRNARARLHEKTNTGISKFEFVACVKLSPVFTLANTYPASSCRPFFLPLRPVHTATKGHPQGIIFIDVWIIVWYHRHIFASWWSGWRIFDLDTRTLLASSSKARPFSSYMRTRTRVVILNS